MRVCSRCKAEKPLTEFYVRKERKSGYDSDCKDCGRALAREWHRKNPERSRATAAAWKAANPEQVDKVTRRARLRAYGLTPECYDEMFALQGGCCAICDKPQDEQSRRMAVDHNHATGAVRALLCLSCNQAIGRLQEDPARMRMAARYIEHFR